MTAVTGMAVEWSAFPGVTTPTHFAFQDRSSPETRPSAAAPDLLRIGSGPLSVSYSLIGNSSGSGITPGTGTGNLLEVEPLLGALQDNGGPTQTHALLPDSPGINSGDPSAVAGSNEVSLYDQRGNGFDRVSGGRIDMGSLEVQSTAFREADFDEDGDVDGSDFLAWQVNFGVTAGTTKADGDADFDGDVDGSDFLIWQTQFGDSAENGGGSRAKDAREAALTPIRPSARDAVFDELRQGRFSPSRLSTADVGKTMRPEYAEFSGLRSRKHRTDAEAVSPTGFNKADPAVAR